ncbi:MAG: TetR/AcrR family transcriptional regulator [Myxococcota bacterium]
MALLEAAAKEFAAAGFHGASVSKIARRAGVTQPLINHHFGSKQGLWREVLDWVFDDARQAFEAAIDPSAPPRQQLLDLVRQAVRFFARRPELARIVSSETNQASEAFDELFERYVGPLIAFTQDALNAAREAAELREDADGRHLHFILVGAAMQPFIESEIARRAFGAEPSDETFVERHAEQIVALVEHGLFVDR